LNAGAASNLLELCGGYAERSVTGRCIDQSNSLDDASQQRNPSVPELALVLPEVGMMEKADTVLAQFAGQLLQIRFDDVCFHMHQRIEVNAKSIDWSGIIASDIPSFT
jgi:hypothetical protein